MRRLGLILALLLAIPGVARAQSQAQVTGALNYTALHAGQKAVLAVVVDIKSGFHAQSHTPLSENLIPFKLTFESSPQLQFGEPVYPTAELHDYAGLGRVSVYTGKVIAYLPLQVKGGAPVGPITLKGRVSYQICNDRVCFAPQDTPVEVTASIVPNEQPLQPNQPELFKDYSPTTQQAATDWTIWAKFGAAILAGLFFNVMPCVLPVLPLKAIGFYEASQHRRGHSFALGLVFSLGLISVFAVLAIFVLVLRLVSWGELFSKGWFMWPIVGLLIALAAGLFGLWNFALPLGVYRFEPRHDTFSGNFFWGALSAILATPCTAPLLPGVLTWAAVQSVFIGVTAMLLVGVGMALPYLILSAVPELARKFPRSGPWTELFKQMMGFMLLAAAAYFGAGRIIAGLQFWWAVVAVVAIASLYLIARTVQLSKNPSAIAFSSVLAIVMLGGTSWWTVKVTGGGDWEPFSEQRFAAVRDEGKPVLVKFTANWCGTCQAIEGTVFRNAKVWKSLKDHGVTAFKVDFSTDSNAPGNTLLLSLNPTGGIPVTAIFGLGSGQDPTVFESFYTSDDLLKVLDATKSSSREAAPALSSSAK